MDDDRGRRLRRHLTLIDAGVQPVVDHYRQHIQCRSGCSDCCHQSFRVSGLEGEFLREGLAMLAKTERDDILERARAYQANGSTPCPVLSQAGACRLYAHRPRICRKYGIPLWHPDRPHEVKTCPLNFRDVPDLDPALVVEPQAEWAADWIDLQRDLGPETDRETIAAHLVRDHP